MRHLSPIFGDLLCAPVWCVFGYYVYVPLPEDGRGEGRTRDRFCLAY